MSKFSYGQAISLRSFDRQSQFAPHTAGLGAGGHGRHIGNSLAELLSRAAHGARSAIGVLFGWSELARQRRQLASLDDHILRDIGIDRDVARRESARHFWDI